MGLNFGSWCGGYATKRIGLMLSYDAQWMMAGVYTSAVVVVHLFVGTIFCGWLRLVTPLFQPADSSNMRRDLVRWLLFFFFLFMSVISKHMTLMVSLKYVPMCPSFVCFCFACGLSEEGWICQNMTGSTWNVSGVRWWWPDVSKSP